MFETAHQETERCWLFIQQSKSETYHNEISFYKDISIANSYDLQRTLNFLERDHLIARKKVTQEKSLSIPVQFWFYQVGYKATILSASLQAAFCLC